MPSLNPKPEVDFKLFLATLALEAKLALEPNQSTSDLKSTVQNLPKAHYMLSILKIIRLKTLNNLSAEESKLLEALINQIQNIYNQIEDEVKSL